MTNSNRTTKFSLGKVNLAETSSLAVPFPTFSRMVRWYQEQVVLGRALTRSDLKKNATELLRLVRYSMEDDDCRIVGIPLISRFNERVNDVEGERTDERPLPSRVNIEGFERVTGAEGYSRELSRLLRLGEPDEPESGEDE